MKKIPNDLYKRIVKLSGEVKNNLMKKGVAVPVQNSNGTVSVGSFTIVKTREGYYNIQDKNGEVMIDRINLPQTAAVLANGLALGRFKDTKLIEHDKKYGYALFEEIVQKKAIENSITKPLEYFDLAMTKASIAKAKKDYHKQDVVRSFQKLIKLV